LASLKGTTVQRVAIVAAVLGVLILLGCAGFQQMAAEQEQRRKILKEIGKGYGAYWNQNPQKAPQQAADLEPLLDTPEAKAALTDGSVVVNYGITGRAMHAQGGPFVLLAYESKVPNGDGFVVNGNFDVKHMTSIQLNDLPNRGKPSE
jgi:hypothetical protein